LTLGVFESQALDLCILHFWESNPGLLKSAGRRDKICPVPGKFTQRTLLGLFVPAD
jgi:hypothetical protein